MRYTRTTTLALLLTLIAFGMSACQESTSRGMVFNGGTNGVLFSFEDGTPQSVIFDNGQTPFQLMLRATNEGEFDTRDIQWRITGINTNDYPLLQTEGEFDEPLAGTTKLQDDLIEGETRLIEMGGDICYEGPIAGGGTSDFTITANMCYGYATLVSSSVCVRENYLDGNDETCDPDTTSQFSVSGAPLTVTDFKQQASGRHELRLDYTVALKDNVDIWAPYQGQDCKSDGRTDRISEGNRVYVRVDTRGLGEISCMNLRDGSTTDNQRFNGQHILDTYEQQYLTGNAIGVYAVENDREGYLRLGSDNTATLRCTLDMSDSRLTDSLSTLNIAFSYYVGDSVSTTMSVTHTDSVGSACEGGPSSTPEERPSDRQGGDGTDAAGSSSCSSLRDQANAACDESPSAPACVDAQRAILENGC